MKKMAIDIIRWFQFIIRRRTFGHYERSSRTGRNVRIYNKKNLYMYRDTNIDSDAIIMNTNAKVIFKKHSGAAVGLTIITGNHLSLVGRWFKSIGEIEKKQYDNNSIFDQDVVVEEDVWIAANVTLLNGVHIGRGAEIGAGSVVRKKIPPYAVVVGNPAKVIGFKFTPCEIIEHEKNLYPYEERLPLDLIENNYDKYFLNRIKKIKEFSKI